MAHESTIGTFRAASSHIVIAEKAMDIGYGVDDATDDDLPSFNPGWWIVPCVLCGGSMIASAVLLL